MKAITAVCATGASVPAIANGRVSRHRGDGENAEIQLYLSKLKDLVPFMPKNKKLSKLDVILNAIDYIYDLQAALESHPAINQFDAETVLNGIQQQQQQQQMHHHHHHRQQQNSSHNQSSSSVGLNRQPLGIRASPNTILSNNNTQHHHQHQPQHHSVNSNLSSDIMSTSLTVSFILYYFKKNSTFHLFCYSIVLL